MDSHKIPPQATFTLFSKLPRELRLLIWEFSLPDPRIVKLCVAEQATDCELRWWRRVSSNKAIDECEDDYDAPYIDAGDIRRLDIAAGDIGIFDTEVREVYSDESWIDLGDDSSLFEEIFFADGRGPIKKLPPRRKKPQKRILHDIDCLIPDVIPQELWRPATLYGFQSSASIPTSLLACRESYMAGSLRYSKTFSSLGALPQTYFDYKNDILYLPYAATKSLSVLLESVFLRDELANVRNLAIKWSSKASMRYADNSGDPYCVGNLYAFLSHIQQRCQNLKRLIIVSEEYHNTTTDPTAEGSRTLKFMRTSVDASGGDLRGYVRVNGYRIDNMVHSFKYLPGEKLITAAMMKKAFDYWKRRHPEWNGKFPEIEYQVLTTVREETRLLHEAAKYERRHQKGCWWINPNDRNDFDYFVGDALDRDVVALLDGL
ncbi:hypothetical protein ACMFMF_005904 [Clarireedia jacksonii]